MKKKVIVIVVFLFLVGVFSVTISLNGFFFATKFYENPLSAYNADAVYDIAYGDSKAKKQIGVFELDEETTLFIGELTDRRFLIANMKVNDKKYAYEGTVVFYEYSDVFDENDYNQTETESGFIKWTIVCNQYDIEKLSDVKLIKEYFLSDGSPLYLIIFE